MPIILGLNVPAAGRPERNANLCIFYNSDFTIYSSLSSFYIPCLLMVVLYYKIFRAIRQRATKASHNSNHHHKKLPPSSHSNPKTDNRNHQLPIPLVDTQWNKKPVIASNPAGVGRDKTKCAAGDTGTIASSSYLVDGDEIEDIDVDSGQSGAHSTPPQVTTVSPSDMETKNGSRRESLGMLNCVNEDQLYSPENELPTPTAKKKPRFLAVFTGSQNERIVQNGGAELLENNQGRKFNKQKHHRRSIKSREKILAQRERKATKTLAIVLGE